MDSSTTNLRNQVKRLHSLHRQKEYVTPSRRDVLCPHFPRLFVRTGKADVTNTYTAMCDNGDVSCDYREEKIGTHLCKRYWADPTLNLELVKKTPELPPPVWQNTDVVINYERPFKDRTATVLMAVSRLKTVPVNLGNFLKDWKEWADSDNGDWYQNYNSAENRYEILNKKNQSGRSFWYNPIHMSSRNYLHEYYVQARGSDDDMYGSIFRYNGSSYYSFEWDSGGLSVNGMALYRNVYNGKGWSKTQLVHRSVRWGSGSKYIHKVSIEVINNRISIKVHRKNGSSFTQIASMDYYDDHVDAPMSGAWGPLTQSQPDTYFWDLSFSTLELLNPDMTPELLTVIPLSYDKLSGGLHYVSKPLSDYFPSDVLDRVLKRNGITMSDVGLIEYWLQDTNVFEDVIFSTAGSMPKVTTDTNAHIAMTSFNYDAAILPFTGKIHSPTRDTTYHISDVSKIDKRVTSIILRPEFTRLFDTAIIEINNLQVRYMSGISSGEHIMEINPPIPLEVGDSISVTYYANDFELEIYKGDYVDTHDKIFKIEGNKLYWHHIPSYEGEENT